MSKQDNGEEPEEQEEVAEPVFPESGPGREEMVSDYLPGSEDWQAKTHLDPMDPAAIAALRQFGSIYSEVQELQPMIDKFLDNFMKSKTSVGGLSRQEYESIMKSMYGSSGDSEGSMAMKLVGAEDD